MVIVVNVRAHGLHWLVARDLPSWVGKLHYAGGYVTTNRTVLDRVPVACGGEHSCFYWGGRIMLCRIVGVWYDTAGMWNTKTQQTRFVMRPSFGP